jgi:hypothetical protein
VWTTTSRSAANWVPRPGATIATETAASPGGRAIGPGNLANQSRVEIKARLGGELALRLRGAVFASYASGDRYTPTLTLSNLLSEFEADLPNVNPARLRRLRSFFFETTTGRRDLLVTVDAFNCSARRPSPKSRSRATGRPIPSPAGDSARFAIGWRPESSRSEPRSVSELRSSGGSPAASAKT